MVKGPDVLEVLHGTETREYPINMHEMTIGRGEGNDIVLLDEYASRKHARITFQDGSFRLVDLGSKNGTLLNSKKIDANKPYPIQVGDTIGIGDFKISLCSYNRGSDRPSAPAQPKQAFPQKSARSVWVRITFIVLGIAVLGVLTWLAITLLFSQPQSAQDQSATAAIPAAAPAPQSNPSVSVPRTGQDIITAVKPGWKTYLNTNDGYSVDYPDGWSILSNNDRTVTIAANTGSASFIVSKNSDTAKHVAIYLDPGLSNQSVTNKEFHYKADATELCPKPWFMYYWRDTVNNQNLMVHSETYLMEAGENSFLFSTAALTDEYNSYPFKEIAASFKVLGQ